MLFKLKFLDLIKMVRYAVHRINLFAIFSCILKCVLKFKMIIIIYDNNRYFIVNPKIFNITSELYLIYIPNYNLII